MTDVQPGDKPETLLITLSGKDRPGVTSSVFTALSGAGVEVLDIEQIVLRRQLILGILVTAPATREGPGGGRGDRRVAGHDRRHRPWRGRQQVPARRPLARHDHRYAAPRVRDGRRRRADRRRRRQHRTDRADGALPRHRDRPARLGRRHRRAAHRAGRRGRRPGCRHRRPARQPAASRHPPDRDGRRLHPDPGRGHRDARRPRRLRGRGRPRHRGGHAWRAGLRGVAALAGRLLAAYRPRPSTRCTTPSCSPPAPGPWCGPYVGSATGSPWCPAASASSSTGWPRTRHPLLARQRARDRRRRAHRPDPRPVVDRAGKAAALREFAAEIGVPRPRPSPSATAPTTSTCSTPPGWGIAYNAKPLVQDAADTSVNVPYSTRSCTSSHLPRGDRRPPTPRPGSSPRAAHRLSRDL